MGYVAAYRLAALVVGIVVVILALANAPLVAISLLVIVAGIIGGYVFEPTRSWWDEAQARAGYQTAKRDLLAIVGVALVLTLVVTVLTLVNLPTQT